MADEVKEAPRGEQFLQSMVLVETMIGQGYQFLESVPDLNHVLTIHDLSWSTYYALHSILVTLHNIEAALAKLASRGFFDDNRVELTTEVLKQLREKKNA